MEQHSELTDVFVASIWLSLGVTIVLCFIVAFILNCKYDIKKFGFWVYFVVAIISLEIGSCLIGFFNIHPNFLVQRLVGSSS